MNTNIFKTQYIESLCFKEVICVSIGLPGGGGTGIIGYGPAGYGPGVGYGIGPGAGYGTGSECNFNFVQ